jgi:3D (Asp-Asp-Asp) domain-containing protein
MSRIIKAACCVLAFLVIATVTLPVRSYYSMAAEANYLQVTVTDSAVTSQYSTEAATVSEFFLQNDIQLNAKDLCSIDLATKLINDMEIVITRGITVTVSVDGLWEKRRVSQGTTVVELQTLLQNEYGKALVYDGDGYRELLPDDVIILGSWRTETFTHTEQIPFETHEMETTAVMSGKSHVRQEGEPGVKEITTTVIYIGEQETHRGVINEEVLHEPVPTIIDVGIGGELGTTTNTSAPDFHYVDKYVMNASAYTAGFESTGKNPGDPGYGRTATGAVARRGIVAVDPRVIPLGTKLYVEGYGFSLASDVGGMIKGHKIDLFYESLEDALQFGRRNLDVYVLE